MKKFFGHNKSRTNKSNSKDGPHAGADDSPISTPIYQQHAVSVNQPPAIVSSPNPPQLPPQLPRNPSREEDRREVISPYIVPAPLGIPQSPSLYHTSQASLLPSSKIPRDRDSHSLRKSPLPGPPVVSNILRALEPPNVETIPYSNRSASEDGYSTIELPRDYGEKREKKGFWNWERSRDHDRDRYNRDRGRDHRREDEGAAELTKMIGYLTATASEDWALVLDVCDRVSASENNAKEAIKALRKEFKYGEPPGQLSAARLWAIMLRNSSNTFITQSTNRKFLETIEELLMHPKTSPVVRERLLDVVAAAAYASDAKGDRDSFRGLWRRVKPIDKPDEGMPFSMDDVMFNLPVTPRTPQYGVPDILLDAHLPIHDITPASPPPPTTRSHRKRKSPTRNRIIPHDEDVRRLLQECKIGQGNASLLSQALFHAKPESFKKDPVVREFYHKCRASQELIFAQVPWATAEAEKSIQDRDARSKSKETNGDVNEITKEEQLLNEILDANGELLEALNQYEDMDRVAMERKAEYRSMRENRIDRRVLQEAQPERTTRSSVQHDAGSPSPSPPPSMRSTSPHQSPEQQQRPYPEGLTNNLAPPHSGPWGPRSPGQFPPRTPSPRPINLEVQETNGTQPTGSTASVNPVKYDNDARVDAPIQPSAKALGKQKAVDVDQTDSYSQHTGEDSYYDTASNKRNSHTFDDSDHEDDYDLPWHRPTQYVYDAAAERTAQRLREGHDQQALLVNGVH
ncbi:hypothetical protein P691DRAFT_803828 [Macrolepiota fuliginosa MF-IS2]|uniref:VHS domain-containing protein n=1 Tax=Macrolepiota fuliginosa MF-IS2 TaxID=1400762 RepID=A0A9P5XA54_9AGAR|nr:hypothetical protein P691DRAFT_803828 [Macrolepiota fuliginosa MF-IS2]